MVEFYIIRRDNTGGELKRRLIEKARQGVRVHVLYDKVGSSDLIESSLEELRAAGVDVRMFNTTQGRANWSQLNFRNHRKIVVVLEQDFADAKLVKAQELRDRGFWFRFGVRGSRLLAPIQ